MLKKGLSYRIVAPCKAHCSDKWREMSYWYEYRENRELDEERYTYKEEERGRETETESSEGAVEIQWKNIQSL